MTYCPGSDVEGEVLLEFPQVHDEQIDGVFAELQGMRKVKSLWKRGSTYPPPNSHILRLLFRFHLSSGPTTMPSVESHDSVSIVYYVEVVSLRPTTFLARNDKRIRERLVVVSRGDPTLSTTYCAGSDVEGEVRLEFPKVQDEMIDEVTVELRGTVKVSSLHAGQRHPSTESRQLIHEKKSLWKRGSAYPTPPDSHVLRLPFNFHLPLDPKILPSVSWDEWRNYVMVSYHIEAIALRPRTLFSGDKRIRESLAVVSRGDPSLCESIRALGEPEGGPTWKTVHEEKQMRRGLWGEYSIARVELLVPNKHGILPHCVDIPLLIKIKTTTARLPRTKADKHPEGKPIFPAVDFGSDSTDYIYIKMRQKFTVRAGSEPKNSINETVLAYLKRKDLLPSSYHKHWQADTTASDSEEMGRWVQQWMVQRTVKLHQFPPTFSSDLADCAYKMSVEVPFPGIGNSMHVSMPVTLDSGIDQATPMKNARAPHQLQASITAAVEYASTGGGAGVCITQDVQPPTLPPTYFDAVYRDDGSRDGT
ncbi:hypothetical protein GSI_01421 [Ganoderma sinense ZZ0214-1]|uniref:Arrestin-like N-terminal domain-containing protein n=1 Tax=Ganoderma sinense ZZ0214-1 TaxID=1077348 RepID=A0A2G8SVD2_9APHY|nr:hypothetical protein GSI_01421 [Ganoderma sinense ZZ0214-1]